MIKILGVDPGGHTGLALFTGATFTEGTECQSIYQLQTHLDLWRPDQIVMEDFQGGYGHTNQRDPLWVLGAVDMWALQHAVPLTLQNPSILRVYLARVGHPHPSRHVRCAAAHVRYYLDRRSAELTSAGNVSPLHQ